MRSLIRSAEPCAAPPMRRRDRLVGLMAALVLGTFGSAFAAPAAHAETIGTVLVVPGESIDLAAIRLRTSQGCPATANAFYARMWGQGFPAEGLVVTANTSAGISFAQGFDVYLAQTMRDFADLNSVPVLAGRYDIVVSCIDKFASRVKGEFTGALEFTSPNTYRAVGDSMPAGPPPPAIVVGGDGALVEQGLNPLDSVPAPGQPAPVQPGVGQPGQADSGQAQPGQPAAPQVPTVPDGSVPAGNAAPSSPRGGASYLPLVLIGLLIVVPGAVAIVHGVRRRRTP